MTWPTLPDGRYAVLRTCRPDGATNYPFTWDLTVGATNTAPDWDPDPGRDCGGGLHGLLWGCGSAGLLHRVNEPDTVWLVLAVDPVDVATPVADGTPDKVRFRACEVLHAGDRASAVEFLAASGGASLPIVYGTSTSGVYGTSTSGDGGTSTSGDGGTSTSGDGGVICITFWDGSTASYRRKIGEIDGVTLKPNTPYRIVDGEFVEVAS